MKIITKEEQEQQKIEQEIKKKETIQNQKVKVLEIMDSKMSELKTFGFLENFVCPICRKFEEFPDMMNKDMYVDIYNLRNGIFCDICHTNSILTNQNIFFNKLKEAILGDAFNYAYLLFGAKESMASVSMKANQMNDLYLSDIGIAEDSKILDINLTPNCNLFMLTPIPNNTRYTQTIIHNNILSFYATNVFGDELPSDIDNKLVVTVKWLDKDIDDLNTKNLMNALNNYIDDNPYELIMNANRALELICTKICYKEFTNNFDRYCYLTPNKRKAIKKIKKKEYVPFSYMLDNFINEICQIKNINSIDNDVLDKIKIYMNYRNDIAHQGELENTKQLTRNEMAEILATAILGSSLMLSIFTQL